ncbi:hypothetical protein PVBG_05634 [Plasmodium vivax Brazil I]|uniref:VIR protein n=1 Tax=Plasmodium vivax (strain Brazil I) TaxID=1033975 RepID=A0A0J9VNT9_PLAV1|nr:hypothetical protein PVBG_05634 [Plasmodium vivax Brazil I]
MERKNEAYLPHLCENYLKNLGDEFRMKKLLYRFYDLYTELKNGKNNRTNSIPCHNISLIVSEYYDYKNSIDKDKDFQKQFKDLKKIIQKETPFPQICTNYNKLDYVLPEVISPPKAEPHETASDNLKSEGSSQKGQNTDLGQGTDVRGADDKSVVLSTRNFPQELKLQEQVSSLALENPTEDSHEEQLLINIPPEEQILTTLSQGNHVYRTRSPREQLDTVWEQGTKFPGEETASPDPNIYPLEGTQNIEGNRRGMFGKIGESVINVLGDVDPVPVVGVSEEDEDAYVEFLVVSMDHSQENSQIFKIMKVGILDMAQ